MQGLANPTLGRVRNVGFDFGFRFLSNPNGSKLKSRNETRLELAKLRIVWIEQRLDSSYSWKKHFIMFSSVGKIMNEVRNFTVQ